MVKLKDKKIVIADSYQQIIHPGNLWAYYRHVSSQEKTEARINGFEVDIIIVINWRDDVYPGCYLKIGDSKWTFEVVDVDDFEGYKHDLKLRCKRMLRGVPLSPYEG